MPLDIAVQTTGGEERVRVQNDQRHQVFAYHVSAEPTSVAIDPDYWILRPAEIQSGVKETPSLLTIVCLAPNPANDRLRVDFALNHESGVDMDVFDVAGRRVLTRSGIAASAGPNTETVDIRPLAAGIYFLRLRSGAGDAAKKFVVVR
jgi:hypothetical protein